MVCLLFYIFFLPNGVISQQAINEKNLCLKENFYDQNKDCLQLTELDKGILSFRMMNCHYQRSGRKPINCEFINETFQQCTQALDSHYWNVFTQFYILVQHHCQISVLVHLQTNMDERLNFIQYQQQFLNQNLKQSKAYLDEILIKQQNLSIQSNQLIKHVEIQQQTIETKRNDEELQQKKMLQQINTLNQQIILYHEEIESSFKELSSYYQVAKYYIDLIYSQGAQLNSLLFYCFDILIIWILTTSKKLIEYRFDNCLLIAFSFILEYQVQTSYLVKGLLFITQITTLTYGYISYKDYEEMTYSKLQSIERKLSYFDLSEFRQKAKKFLLTTNKKNEKV